MRRAGNERISEKPSLFILAGGYIQTAPGMSANLAPCGGINGNCPLALRRCSFSNPSLFRSPIGYENIGAYHRRLKSSTYGASPPPPRRYCQQTPMHIGSKHSQIGGHHSPDHARHWRTECSRGTPSPDIYPSVIISQIPTAISPQIIIRLFGE